MLSPLAFMYDSDSNSAYSEQAREVIYLEVLWGRAEERVERLGLAQPLI